MTPACSNQPTTSPNDTVPNAAAIAESNAPPRPRPHSFHEPLDLAESQLDGVEVRAVPRQQHRLAPPRFDRLPHLRFAVHPPADPAPRSAPAWVWEREGARGTLETPHQPPLRSTSSRHSHPHRDRWLQPGWSSPHGSSAPYPRHVVPGGVGVGQGHGEVEAALIHEHRPVRVDLLDPGQVPPPGLWTLFTGVDRLFFSSIPISVPSGTWWLC